MQIPVAIERLNGQGYRVRAGEPFSVSAEGPTREAALQNFRVAVRKRLDTGIEFVSVDVGVSENPWLRLKGIYKDDPLFDEWQQAIADYRKQVDEDPDAR